MTITELEKAEHRDKEYHYFMGRTDALKEVLTRATKQFHESKIDSGCFTAVADLIDEMIKADDE